MRAFALLCALLALVLIGAAVATSRATAAQTTPNAALTVEIGHYQHVAWHWQRVMGLPQTPSSFSPVRSTDTAYRGWVLALWKQRAQRLQRTAAKWMADRIHTYQTEVDHWRRVMGGGPLRQTAAAGGREATFFRWRATARRVLLQAAHPPYEPAWQCIHGYEGSWTDASGPYYGGLQMDLGFQQHYGGYLLRVKGTAEHWTPLEQMWVAARAYRSGRGFYPWPNTARACGLL
jgi:hypothetical protein